MGVEGVRMGEGSSLGGSKGMGVEGIRVGEGSSNLCGRGSIL